MSRTRWSSFCAVPCWRFIGTLVVASLATIQVDRAYAVEARTYPVEAGDELQVVVYGDENTSSVLSGRFLVEPDGSIYYPLLGKLAVAGRSPVEIADLLHQSLSTQVRITAPTVSVAEFAPVFLVGDVARTGPFQFQPDMTVFQLVLEAGGISQVEASESARLSLLQELSSLELDNYSLRVQKARLLAEIEGIDFDTAPLEASTADEASIVSAEAAIFAVRQRARESRRRTYDAQREGYDQEISSIEKSIVLHDEEVRLQEEQLTVQQGLAERGLSAHSARRDAQRQLAVTRREALEFQTALFRARQNRIAVDQALLEAETRVDEANVEKLRDVELAYHQNEIALTSAKAKFAQFDTARNAAQNALGRAPQYRLIRRVSDEYTSRLVDEVTKLERGDVVRVTFAEGDAKSPIVGQPRQKRPEG
ncbi:polysaccharide biosynthesis/export family protein (plasmid) [Mesorhizobium sp. AaZ16]|uniref:polysaccharide biosynthesis/export family protein n=1 Tax=Mesorhizobium sp. AaZ16 TaxID=3402289 RepID=UPI00374F78BE